ncbi:phage tail protein I [Lentibacillus sp. Marseille-P4043]|uniref:phage tail protein I n=1 Tax=Lentibacillus sp. Marseille-P4043 TaxID=2040293 RepID=UPI000D0BB621|nr:phage tail protein I [Lentibacillus sp. Marseille-P4043]
MSNQTIRDVNLLDILPANLRSDPDIIAASKAVDLGFLELTNEINNIMILPNVNNASEAILDHLAYFFHVDFYDMELDIGTKRKLVNESVFLHQIKGTPLAVETLIQTLFSEGEVSEWFDYGDTPYRFRVLTSDPSATTDRAEIFVRALDSVKNKRSTLDKVVLLQVERMDLYCGGFVHQGNIEEYR